MSGAGPVLPLRTVLPLGIPPHDYISLNNNGANPTSIVFKTGGASGTTVATITITYSGSDITAVAITKP